MWAIEVRVAKRAVQDAVRTGCICGRPDASVDLPIAVAQERESPEGRRANGVALQKTSAS